MGLLDPKIIKGQKHILAYITPSEANTLEDLGGEKTITSSGILAYPPPGEYGGAGYTGGSSSSNNSGVSVVIAAGTFWFAIGDLE